MTSSVPSTARLAAGERFADRYEVIELLGEGGMGAVYRAIDLALGDAVALKILAPRHGVSPTAVLRFRQEVRLARRVTHPNVVRVFDIGEERELLYFTMELVPGETLSAMLRREGRLAAGAAVSVGAAIAEGLTAAHAAGVVHRDLKPSNIVIDPGGRVALADFGIAQSLTEDSDFTQEGMIVGTSRYMAPEQIFRRPIGGHTDVFALGLLIHEMLTGELPERTPAGCAVDLRAAGAGAPPGLGPLLERCLLVSAADRPSAEDVARALRGLVPDRPDDEDPARGVEVAPGSVSSAPTTVQPAVVRASQGITALSARPIAVLPFQYVGVPENGYLGGTIAAELVDTLAQIRGIKILGTGATAPFVKERDPVAICASLGASMVLDGTVQTAPGGRTRMTVRLLDAGGVQRWSVRHDGVVADLFSFQASIARVLCERLRVELTVISHADHASSEAIELYLVARRDFRGLDSETVLSALEGFERCVALAPSFLPAVSGLAMASVRAWFFDRGVVDRRDRGTPARESVARALAVAPHLAETHLAAGMLAVQNTDFAEASRSLCRALHIAPTCVEALEYLGMLLCEAGKLDAGFERLSLALELDPTRAYALIYLGRAHALIGDTQQAARLYSNAEAIQKQMAFAIAILQMRLAGWLRDPSALRLSAIALGELATARWRLVRLYVGVLRGEIEQAEASAIMDGLIVAPQSPRALSSVAQILCEAWLLLDRPDRAMGELGRASDAGLMDLLWVERCPLLEPLRRDPRYPDIHRATMKRADAVVV